MNKKELFEQMLNDMINIPIIAKIENGELINVKSEIYLKTVNEKIYIGYVPYEFKKEKLHGNTRLALAKEFVDLYKFEQVKELFYKRLEKERKLLELEEKNKYRLINLIEELNLYRFKNFVKLSDISVKFYAGLKKYILDFNIKCDKYRINNIQVYNNDNCNKLVYKINYVEMDYELFVKKLDELYNLCIEFEKKNKKEFEKDKKEKEIKQKINKLYFDNIKNIIILKTNKKTFIAFSNNIRYSVESGKCGKYYNTNYSYFEKLILKKGVEKVKYTLLDKNATTYMDDDFYLNLPYKDIV